FQNLAAIYPYPLSRKAAGILVYNGLYNPRLKGGSLNLLSMNA
ncbi:MAG: hypothetical protein ACI892_002426, partial [Marinobacter maritimus]